MTFPEFEKATNAIKTKADPSQGGRELAGEQHRLRLKFREDNPVISVGDEDEMIQALKDKTRWTSVAFLLSVMPTFSVRLMHAMLQAAVDIRNASANRIFIDPCLRVFDVFAVNDFLQSLIANGTKSDKIGAPRCFYWLHSRIIHFRKGDGPMQKELIEYRWVGARYSYSDANGKYFLQDQSLLPEYESRVREMRKRRNVFLLDRAEAETDAEILLSLFRELPAAPEEYSDPGLKERAEYLYRMKERILVLKTVEPYRKTAGDMSDERRAELFNQAKEESQRLMAEVQAKILRNCGL